MGNQPSSSSSDGCVPCILFFGNDKNHNHNHGRSASSLIGSPMPETPMATRQKRHQVATAVSNAYNNNNNNNNSSSSSSSNSHGKSNGKNNNNNNNNMLAGLLPPKYGNVKQQQQSQPQLLETEAVTPLLCPPSHRQAVVTEGPHAEQALHEHYELQQVLGVGSTSTVQQCVHKASGEVYACKIIDITEIEERFSGMMVQFQTEIEALRQLHHPAIIGLYDVYVTETKIFIIMECMQGGELFDYVVQKGTLTEEEAAVIVRKVTSALVYMHEKNIVHRDLKPENLLLKRKPELGKHSAAADGEEIDVKIIDFGLSKAMEEPVARTFLGTRGYLAPEMLQRRDYTRAVDTWALGVIVFVLLCGCLPFDDDSATVPSDDLVRAKFVLRFPRWAKHLSASAKDLLTHLLDVNPMTRYTAEQALQHPWVQGKTARKDSLLQSPGRIRASPAVRGKTNNYNGRKTAAAAAAANAKANAVSANMSKYMIPPKEGAATQPMSPEQSSNRPGVVRKNSL